jgi:hypothetical protein
MSSPVMPGLVPDPKGRAAGVELHAFIAQRLQDVDGRNKCGHDGNVHGGRAR